MCLLMLFAHMMSTALDERMGRKLREMIYKGLVNQLACIFCYYYYYLFFTIYPAKGIGFKVAVDM